MVIRNTTWSFILSLSATDAARARRFIAEEIIYYNALVDGLSGPLRTMSATIQAMTGRLETLFGEVAATGVDVRTLKEDDLPSGLASLRDVIFRDGKLNIDIRTLLILDVARQPSAISGHVRRGMAIEMLRAARDQAAVLSNTLNRDDQVYKFAVEALSPIDPRSKRHLQLPRAALKTVDHGGKTAIAVPYLATPLHIPTPPIQWNYLVLRDDEATGRTGQWTMELSKETGHYGLKKTDGFLGRKKKARQG